MGSPAYPREKQIEELKRAGELAHPEAVAISPQGEITLEIPPNGVALVECG
jgi:xylan 1,4-beta-xylosidase